MGRRGKKAAGAPGVRADATATGAPASPPTTPQGPGGIRPHDPGYDAVTGLARASAEVKRAREQAEAALVQARAAAANPGIGGREYEAGRKAARIARGMPYDADAPYQRAEGHRYNARRAIAGTAPGPAKTRATAGYKAAAAAFKEAQANRKAIRRIAQEARKLRI